MKGIFINCPSKQCKKMLLKNAYLRPGSFMTVKCYHCGTSVEVESEPGKIKMTMLPVDQDDSIDDDDGSVVMMHF